MRRFPNIPELASARDLIHSPNQLTSAGQAMASVQSPARVLCLRIFRRKSAQNDIPIEAAAEAFLRFSPRLAARSGTPLGVEWIFADIASTSHLFGGEAALLDKALALAFDVFRKATGDFNASAAISDTPSGAQALAASRLSCTANCTAICPPGEERANLQPLSLPLLLQLEGLIPWQKPAAIESMADFFDEIGFRAIGELGRFELESMRERWGKTGELAWKRLRGLDRQPISPFIPSEPLREGGHFDFPISLVALLMHGLQRPLERLFSRLEGRALFAEKAVLELRGEYSSGVRRIELEPCSPSRNLNLFIDLLERKLQDDGFFEDPIRTFDLSIVARPESERQLDFFEPRDSDFDRLESLISILRQSSARAGFFSPRPALLPEDSWSCPEGWEAARRDAEREANERKSRAVGRSYRLEALNAKDRTALATKLRSNGAAAFAVSEDTAAYEPSYQNVAAEGGGSSSGFSPRPALSGAPGWGRAPEEDYEDPSRSVRPMPEYGIDVLEAPRPTRLLESPRLLSANERREIKILSSHPIERLETSWWQGAVGRDYYFAASDQGQCLWIYQDRDGGDWFLHGYFD